MKRREFVSLLGTTVAVWPKMAPAQRPTMPVIGPPGNTVSGIGLKPQG